MKTIPLTKGFVATVDDSDHAWLSSYNWFAVPGRQGTKVTYAYRSFQHNGKWIRLSMHREILNTPTGMCSDHINGNGLDNRRANLRICTKRQNQYNQPPKMGRQYKGVFKHGPGFKARCAGKELGQYPTAQLAAAAYNKAAIKMFGEFARLNPC